MTTPADQLAAAAAALIEASREDGTARAELYMASGDKLLAVTPAEEAAAAARLEKARADLERAGAAVQIAALNYNRAAGAVAATKPRR